MESLASFRQLRAFRRIAGATASTQPVRVAALTLLILTAGLLPAEGRAGGQASVQASVTIVDTRVGQAALEGAAAFVAGLGGRAEPVPVIPPGGLPVGSGADEWSDGSGLFSLRLVNSCSQIDPEPPHSSVLAEPLLLEIQFPAN